jgi:hypothetical protein
LQANRQAIVVQADRRRGRGQTADIAEKREATGELERLGIDETVAPFLVCRRKWTCGDKPNSVIGV